MSILTENLVMLEHKQGEMIDNFRIFLLSHPYSSPPPWGLVIAITNKIRMFTKGPYSSPRWGLMIATPNRLQNGEVQ